MEAYVESLVAALRNKGGKLEIGTLGGLVKKPSGVQGKLKAIIQRNSDKFALEKGAGGHHTVHAISHQDHNFDNASLRYMFRALYSIHSYYANRAWPRKRSQWRSDYANGMSLDQDRADDVYNMLHVEGYVKKEGGKLEWNVPRIQDAVNQMPDAIKALPLARSSSPLSAGGGVADAHGTPIQASNSSGANNSSVTGQKKVWTLKDGTQCTFVDDEPSLRQCISSDPVLQASGGGRTFVAIDCEGVPEALELIQVATQKGVYIFDSKVIGEAAVCLALEPLLVSQNHIKLMHDLHKDVVAINKFSQISLRGTLDTQLVGESVWGEVFLGFNGLLRKLELPQHPSKDFIHAKMKSGVDLFAERPIPSGYLEYAAFDVSLLLRAAPPLQAMLAEPEKMAGLIRASDLRASNAAANDGARAICFDITADYKIASADLLRAVRPEEGFYGEELVIQSETDEVISLLPTYLRAKFTPKTRHKNILLFGMLPPPSTAESEAISLDKLSDIILDIGRRPQCWVNDERVFLCDDESKKVTSDDVNNVARKLGDFGSDNRAGLDAKLHRFSAMRNRDGQIAGITVRIGRNVLGNAAMLMDFLMGTEKSILILGEPGSGKTTIVREATRKLAESKNVIVVDTSNEIAGDGMIPHKCIGLARRMMVPSLDQQSAVMVECVQNHTPHVMVIDEIGRPKEVQAARTVKQRGVRMIASAHGDLRKLLKNKDLRGLVGGVELVTMGDDMARQEAKRKQRLAGDENSGESKTFSISKTKAQRGGEPTFDIIVEVRRGARHEWKIVADSANAVDRILDSLNYKAQLRTRDPDTGNMALELIDS